MKKTLLSLVILIAGLTNVNAQEDRTFKVGAHLGLPIGNLGDAYNFNLGLDVAYLWRVNGIIQLGATTGFSNYFGKNIKDNFFFSEKFYTVEYKIEDTQIIPVAATAKFNVAKQIFIGGDVGYAFFLGGDSEDTGAFYYQPKVGYDVNKSEIYLSYKGMSKYGETIGSINLGFAYNF
jgi:hypothetical protein